MRNLTRKEVKRWFQPLTDFGKAAIQGDVDSVNGYPITFIATKGVYSRVDLCIEGIIESCQKFLPDFNYSHLDRLRKKLLNGIMLEHSDIESMYRSLGLLEDRIIRVPYDKVMGSVRDTMIAVHLRRFSHEN